MIAFTAERPRSLIQQKILFAFLGAQFLIPAISYIVAPEAAVQTLDQLDRLLGGAGLPPESTHLWHMLAVGNVMTLAFLCFLLAFDVRRFAPALPGLLFLKGFSATYSLFIGLYNGLPGFFAVTLLDGTTTLAMLVFAVRALRDLEGGGPWWSLLLRRPSVIEANLGRLAASGAVPCVPNLFQVLMGVLYMLHRLLFRSHTVGTSSTPVRRTLRARLLAYRPIRAPFLLMEGVIFPFELSGLALDEGEITRHLLGAHHDGDQCVYDLQLLSVHPGALERLREQVCAVIAGGPRSEWLRDLCVHEGYHEGLLAHVEAAIERRWPLDTGNPDLQLFAWLAWCARQPASPAEAWAIRSTSRAA